MKRYLEYIKEAKKDLTLEEQWFEAIDMNDIDKVKEFITNGFDINTTRRYGMTALMDVSLEKVRQDIFKLLLQQSNLDISIKNVDGNSAFLYCVTYCEIQIMIENIILFLEHPKIDVTLKDKYGHNFLDNISLRTIDNSFLIDYDLQRKILDNDRKDILVFFDKYGLVHLDIKKENPDIFKAVGWGLIFTGN